MMFLTLTIKQKIINSLQWLEFLSNFLQVTILTKLGFYYFLVKQTNKISLIIEIKVFRIYILGNLIAQVGSSETISIARILGTNKI